MEQDKMLQSSAWLLDQAQARGYRVSKTQLTRWHRAGLLPAPRQHSLGKGRGTSSLYPPGTDEQLYELCTVHTRERRLAQIAWHLWWAGYPVSFSYVDAFLRETVGRIEEQLQVFSLLRHVAQQNEGETELPEALLDYLDQAAGARLGTLPLRRARKRTGSEHFPTFLRIVLEIAAGTFNGFGNDYDTREQNFEQRIVEKALGLDAAFASRYISPEQDVGSDLARTLQSFSRWLHLEVWETLLSRVTIFEIVQARDELRTFLTMFAARKAFHPDAPSTLFTIVDETLQAVDARDQALMLVIWLALRSMSLL